MSELAPGWSVSDEYAECGDCGAVVEILELETDGDTILAVPKRCSKCGSSKINREAD